MKLMNTWEKYFLKELIKVFVLFLVCFYGIYVIIDFSTHSGAISNSQTGFKVKELCFFYCREFVKRADILIPFALLISNIRTLCVLNIHNELIALQAAGVSIKRLMRPFIIAGFVMTFLMYVNAEFILPYVNSQSKYLGSQHLLKKNRKKGMATVQHLTLADGSTMLYYSYDEVQKAFIEVYWIKSFDDIYHMKHLEPGTGVPKGFFVDHLVRTTEQGGLTIKESFEEIEMSGMVFNSKSLKETISLPEELSLSDLIKNAPHNRSTMSDKQANALSILYQKLIKPWLCLFAILAPAPYCLRITRNLPVFYIYAFWIFAFVAFNLVLDAASVLGKRQVLSPELSILPLVIIFFLPVGINHVLLSRAKS